MSGRAMPNESICLSANRYFPSTPIVGTPPLIALDKATRIQIAVQGIETADTFHFFIVQLALKQALSQQIPFPIPAQQLVAVASHGLAADIHLPLALVALLPVTIQSAFMSLSYTICWNVQPSQTDVGQIRLICSTANSIFFASSSSMHCAFACTEKKLTMATNKILRYFIFYSPFSYRAQLLMV